MEVGEIIRLIDAKVVSGAHLLAASVDYAFASDLMSDVLTLENDRMLLITGLANLQAVRTAEMSDISTVIIARDKKASPEMAKLAEENGMILVESSYSMFRIAGELYKAGIKPIF